MKRYKFLREGMKSNYDGSAWTIGEWRKTECRGTCYGFNCSKRIMDAMGYVAGEVLVEVEVRGKHFESDNKSTHEEMRIVKAWRWTKADSVSLAVFAAEMVIENYEKLYPDGNRPRRAIEAAKAWLENPTEENRSAAWSAESAAWSAESAAWSAKYSAYAASDTLDKIERWLQKRLKTMEEITG